MESALSSEQGLRYHPGMSPESISKQEQSTRSESIREAISASTAQSLETRLEIVHATPGRVRLRLTNNSIILQLDAISQQLRQQYGVSEVRSSQQTGNIVVLFDTNKLSLPQMIELLQQVGVSEPQAPLLEAEKTDPFAAWQSIDFWKEQGISFIPLITGLFVTGRLGIHGLPAIPVYLLAANATRLIIDSTRGQQSEIGDRDEVIPSPLLPDSVVHAIPGRIRFHIPQIAQDRAFTERLENLLKADSQTTSFRFNRARASLVITYTPDTQLTAPSVSQRVPHWIDLIQKAASVVTQTKPTTATEQPTSESGSSTWAAMKPPALTASLEFIANLPVQAVPD